MEREERPWGMMDRVRDDMWMKKDDLQQEMDAADAFLDDYNEELDSRAALRNRMPGVQPTVAVPRSRHLMFKTDFGVSRDHEINSFDTSLVSKKISSRQYEVPAVMQKARSAVVKPLPVRSAQDIYIAKHQGDMNVFALRPIRPVQPDYKCLSQYTRVMPGLKHPDIAARIIQLEQQCKDFNMFQHHYRMGML